MRRWTAVDYWGGIALPVILLVTLVVLAARGSEPTSMVALMSVGPALAAILAPMEITASMAALTVLVAAVTAAATSGNQFAEALPALVWVIVVSGAAVILASIRPSTRPKASAAVAPLPPVVAGHQPALPPELQDPVTGLPTRAGALTTLGAPLEGDPRLVVEVDVDDLARINDSEGREIGVTILFAVAGRSRYALDEHPGSDLQTVARWSGGGFLVVIDGVDQKAQELMDHIVSKVNDHPIRTDSGLIAATLSAGAVAWRPGEMLTDAASRARRLLHQAKAHGPGHVERDLSTAG